MVSFIQNNTSQVGLRTPLPQTKTYGTSAALDNMSQVGLKTPLTQTKTYGTSAALEEKPVNNSAFHLYGRTRVVGQDYFKRIYEPNWEEVLNSFNGKTIVLKLSQNPSPNPKDQFIGRLQFKGYYPKPPATVTFHAIEGEVSTISRCSLQLDSTKNQNGLQFNFNSQTAEEKKVRIRRLNPYVYHSAQSNVYVLCTENKPLSDGSLSQFEKMTLEYPHSFLKISEEQEV